MPFRSVARVALEGSSGSRILANLSEKAWQMCYTKIKKICGADPGHLVSEFGQRGGDSSDLHPVLDLFQYKMHSTRVAF